MPVAALRHDRLVEVGDPLRDRDDRESTLPAAGREVGRPRLGHSSGDYHGRAGGWPRTEASSIERAVRVNRGVGFGGGVFLFAPAAALD